MGLDGQGTKARFSTEIFHFSTASTSVLGPTQPFMQWVLRGSYGRGKAIKESLLNGHISSVIDRTCHSSTREGCSNKTDLHACHPHKSAYGLKIQIGQRHEGHGSAVVPAIARGVLYCLVHEWDACPMGNIFNCLYFFTQKNS